MRLIQFRDALREAMNEEMRRNINIFLIGEEVGDYGGIYKVSNGMLNEFGYNRIIDTPISELGFTGLGIGAAMNNLRPIVEFMTFNFSLLAIDQIINSASKIRFMSGGQFSVPIVFRGTTGNAGMLGAQHSQNFENWYANCPGLKVVIPSNPYDAKGLLKTSIRDNDPIIFMESEVMYNDIGNVPENEYFIDIGKAVIRKKGKDITLVSFGKMMKIALEASLEVQKNGIDIELIDMRTIRPLDLNCIIKSVKNTNHLIILEESWPLGSISSEITYQIQKHAFNYLKSPIQKINNLDIPLAYSSTLINETLPSVKKVINIINKLYNNL